MDTVLSGLDKLSNVLGMSSTINRWTNAGDQQFEFVKIEGLEFALKSNHRDLRLIGIGAQGVVCSCFDNLRGQKVAIKKLSKPFRSASGAKAALKEIRILKRTNHKNIIKYIEIFAPSIFGQATSMTDIYIVTELMESTLADIISIQLDHHRLSYLIYQLLCGVYYLHRCGILHRDLKPSNIAVNSDCTLRIIDFGLSRSPDNSYMMTPYVMTRYYRAPEVILGGFYNFAADMWSIGCIMAEMCKHEILFKGSDYVDQWHIIESTLGSPNSRFITQFNPAVQTYLKSRPIHDGMRFDDVIKDLDFAEDVENTDLTATNGRHLIWRMLSMDPIERISFVEALNHPYVNAWLEESEVENESFDFHDKDIEESVSRGTWNDLLRKECLE